MNSTMTGRVRKLRDMEIDEISLVDRAANQLASILFSKSQEDAMPGYEEGVELFDSNGDPAGFEDFEVGDIAYDADGNEYVMVEDDGDEAEEFFDEYDEELVGKAANPIGAYRLGRAVRSGRVPAGALDALEDPVMGRGRKINSRVARRAARSRRARRGDTARQLEYGPNTNPQGVNVDRRSMGSVATRAGMQYRYAPTTAALGVGAAGGGAAGAGGMYAYDRKVRKSLGDVLVEELSKSDRDERTLQMAATMGDEIEKAQAQAAEAIAYAEQMHEERALEAFISKAAEYNLPVDPYVLGSILKSAAQVLDRDELDVLDELFTAMGDEIYDEIGALGDTDNSDVLMQVDAYADELVGKSQGSVSHAEASTMLFEANPEAYELYLRENGGF